MLKYFLKVKINTDFKWISQNRELKKEEVIVIQCDSSKKPLERFWRERVKDIPLDNAIEILEFFNSNDSIEQVKKEVKKTIKNKYGKTTNYNYILNRTRFSKCR